MNRRALFSGGSALALLALPKPASAVCAPPAPEHPMIRARRLARELSDAMNDYEGGEWHAIVHPSARSGYCIAFMATDILSPEERIEAALRDIEAALAEKYPGQRVKGPAELTADRSVVLVVTLAAN